LRQRPFRTAMFGQPGAPQTLAARLASTSSAVRRTRELRSLGRGRPSRPVPDCRRRRQSGTHASRARRRPVRDRTQPRQRSALCVVPRGPRFLSLACCRFCSRQLEISLSRER
jgi:hypothetical protein